MFFFKYFSTSSLQGRKFLLESRKIENVTAFVNLFLLREYSGTAKATEE